MGGLDEPSTINLWAAHGQIRLRKDKFRLPRAPSPINKPRRYRDIVTGFAITLAAAAWAVMIFYLILG